MAPIFVLVVALSDPDVVGAQEITASTERSADDDETAAGCDGDERISYAPPQPLVGQTLLVSLESSRPRADLSLGGAPAATPSGERQTELGYASDFSIPLDQPGRYDLQFMVDPTTSCASATVEVGPGASDEPPPDEGAERSAASEPVVSVVAPFLDPGEPPVARLQERPADSSSTGATAPASRITALGAVRPTESLTTTQTRSPTRTPTPDVDPTSTRTPEPDSGPTPTHTPRPTRTPTPAPPRTSTPEPTDVPTATLIPTWTPVPTSTPQPTATPTPEAPVIVGTQPGSAICRSELLIVGRGFGSSQRAVSGQVRITGVSVQDYLSWSASEIRVVVPATVRPGNDGSLDVDVAGRTAHYALRVSC